MSISKRLLDPKGYGEPPKSGCCEAPITGKPNAMGYVCTKCNKEVTRFIR